MTDIEKREKELASLKEELQSYAREIQERERALQIAETAKRREDVTRTDYLFDRINRDNRKLTIEVPPVIHLAPQPQQQNPQDVITTLMATVAAIAGVATLLAVIL